MGAGFEDLLREAQDAAFSGWDFAWLAGRAWEDPPPWDYGALARECLAGTQSVLDMGTGGGEFLATLKDSLPRRCIATEAYAPNVAVARERLGPLGVQVAAIGPDDLYAIDVQDEVYRLPADDGSLDLVLSRHESFDPREVARVLRPGGRFLTQQVGARNFLALNRRFGKAPNFAGWSLRAARAQVESAGLRILRAEESLTSAGFLDIGAVVYYLRAVPWQVEGFTVQRSLDILRGLHEEMARGNPLQTQSDRFLLLAERPA